jgi:transposase-like protein
MATVEAFEKLTLQERLHRYFSEDFKRKKVSELDRNITSISEICREYHVSRASIYRWLDKFSRMRKKQERQVIETKSDTRKLQYLREEVNELHRVVGEKQLKIDFLEKMIEIAEKEYGPDFKKKLSSKHSTGSGSKEKGTGTK